MRKIIKENNHTMREMNENNFIKQYNITTIPYNYKSKDSKLKNKTKNSLSVLWLVVAEIKLRERERDRKRGMNTGDLISSHKY